ncbi:MAG: hypothetical protein WAL67_10315 [Candidatus Cybelea sp.]
MSTGARSLAGNLLPALLCLLVSAGCSANYATPTQPVTPSVGGSSTGMSISKGEKLVYVADTGLNSPYGEVLIYEQGHLGAAPVGTITDGLDSPNQLFVDQAGTLYVSNGGGFITEYPFGSSQPSTTLSFPGGFMPSSLSVDSKGNVYSGADILRSLGGGKYSWYWNIFGFKRGETQPSLQIKSLRNPFGLANDRLGNLYVSWGATRERGHGAHLHVSECPPMSGACVDLSLHTPAYASGGALQLDLKGDLDVGEQDHGVAGWIGIYQPGSVKPNRSIFSHRCYAWTFALDAQNDRLYCTYKNLQGVGLGLVSVFDYGTGKYIRRFGYKYIYNEFVSGVGVYPAQKLGPPFK